MKDKGKSHRPQSAKRRRGVIALAVVAIVGLTGYFGVARETEPEYAPQDVVRADPFIAVHEMNAGPAIPFLPEGQPQPRIEIPDGSYNFGRVGPQDVVTRTFAIRNTGEAPLTISRAYTTCGCTRARLTAHVIPPGKVALATIKFDAGFHDTRGQTVQRGLIIESNDRQDPRSEIWVHASVANY